MMVGCLSLTCKWPSLFLFGYHWLPLATIDLVSDNSKIKVFEECSVVTPILGNC